jgi:hypothetical protein
MSLTQKVYIKLSLNFDLSCSLNFPYKNLVGYKKLRCLEFSKSSFLIFKISNNKIFNVCILLSKLKTIT